MALSHAPTPRITQKYLTHRVHIPNLNLYYKGYDAVTNYNLGDITIVADSGTDSVNAAVFGCFGGNNYGKITVTNMLGTSDNSVIGATIGNYGDIEVRNIHGKSLKVSGVEYSPKYNSVYDTFTQYIADLMNWGNINVIECDITGDINCYAFTGKLNGGYGDITAINKGSFTVDECCSENLNIIAFGDTKNFSTTTGPIKVKNIGESLHISHITSSGTIRIYGVSSEKSNEVKTSLYSTLEEIKLSDFSAKNLYVSGIGNHIRASAYSGVVENNANIIVENGVIGNDLNVYGVGQTVTFPSVNKGQISISNISKPNGELTGIYKICGVGETSTSSILNNGKITVKDIDARYYPVYINGCGMSSSAPQNALVMNAGTLEITGTMPSLYISGVSNSVNADSDNGLFLNTGDITVDTPSSTILYCGGVSAYAASQKVLNAINSGNINIRKAQSEQTHIYGVAYAQEMQSIINWGNIDITGLSDVPGNVVYAVGLAKKSLCAWLNYGNVTTDLNNPVSACVGAVDFDGTVAESGIIAGTGINYGLFTSARTSGNGSTSAWFVDISGNKNVIPDSEWNYSTDPEANNVIPWCTDTELFKSQMSMKRLGYEGSTEPYAFSYEEMLKPTFGFVYNNPLALRYKNATEKEEYNGENILDYTDKSELKGQTLAYLTAINEQI